jgi:signal transduction histidine kinase
LSFSYAIIKDHQGKISVYSPVLPEYAQEMDRSGNSSGPGTQFLIELPIILQEAMDGESLEISKLPAVAALPL